MEFKIKQNITPEDLLQGISWHGETDHDNEAVQKLKELNEFVSDLVAKIFFFQLQMEQVATNQNNMSAKELSEEAKENEKGFRDSVTAMIKWYIPQNASEEKLTALKETLVVNLYRLQEIRKVVENQNTIGEAKLIFQQLGII